tara:strand:- start:176 stop:415 length:240 start_codon:yes stop_codon:yes gene_type:complete
MFKLILAYEIGFIIFWNLLYHSNSGVEDWFEEKILTALFTILSTMALGFGIIYVIYITVKITGVLEKVKKVKDPRRDLN